MRDRIQVEARRVLAHDAKGLITLFNPGTRPNLFRRLRRALTSCRDYRALWTVTARISARISSHRSRCSDRSIAMLAAPPPDAPRDPGELVHEVAAALTGGRAAIIEQGAEPDPFLAPLAQAYAAGLQAGIPSMVAAIAAMKGAHQRAPAPRRPKPSTHVQGPADAPPVTDLQHDLQDAVDHPRAPSTVESTPEDPVNARLLKSLMAIEQHAGASPEKARRIALGIMGERDQAIRLADEFLAPIVDKAEILGCIAELRLELRIIEKVDA